MLQRLGTCLGIGVIYIVFEDIPLALLDRMRSIYIETILVVINIVVSDPCMWMGADYLPLPNKAEALHGNPSAAVVSNTHIFYYHIAVSFC